MNIKFERKTLSTIKNQKIDHAKETQSKGVKVVGYLDSIDRITSTYLKRFGFPCPTSNFNSKELWFSEIKQIATIHLDERAGFECVSIKSNFVEKNFHKERISPDRPRFQILPFVIFRKKKNKKKQKVFDINHTSSQK